MVSGGSEAKIGKRMIRLKTGDDVIINTSSAACSLMKEIAPRLSCEEDPRSDWLIWPYLPPHVKGVRNFNSKDYVGQKGKVLVTKTYSSGTQAVWFFFETLQGQQALGFTYYSGKELIKIKGGE